MFSRLLLATFGLLMFHGITTADEMRSWLLQNIDLQQSVETARRFMENNGFECVEMINADFHPISPEGTSRKAWLGIDYIFCDFREKNGLFFWRPVRRWQVALVHENGHLKEIGVSTGLIGL